jgi:hypothetical protein
MPAPARRQGSRRAIQDTPYSPISRIRCLLARAGSLLTGSSIAVWTRADSAFQPAPPAATTTVAAFTRSSSLNRLWQGRPHVCLRTKPATRSASPTTPELAQGDHLGAELRDSLAPVARVSDTIHQRHGWAAATRVRVGTLIATGLRGRQRVVSRCDRCAAQPRANDRIRLKAVGSDAAASATETAQFSWIRKCPDPPATGRSPGSGDKR